MKDHRENMMAGQENDTVKGLDAMSKSLFMLPLCLFLLFNAFPAFADLYDDCLTGCGKPLDSCIKQAHLTAGNIQEEQDYIAACNKTKDDCIQACKDAEASSSPSPPPKVEPPPRRPPVDLNGEIKTYENDTGDVPATPPQVQSPQAKPPVDLNGEIKTYEFK
jgi:hypothetical protein